MDDNRRRQVNDGIAQSVHHLHKLAGSLVLVRNDIVCLLNEIEELQARCDTCPRMTLAQLEELHDERDRLLGSQDAPSAEALAKQDAE